MLRNKLYGVSLILFELFIIIVLIAVLTTPSQNCPLIVSYYDELDRPIEVNILKSEHTYVARGDMQVLCRYKKITIDSLSMEYYNGSRSD